MITPPSPPPPSPPPPPPPPHTHTPPSPYLAGASQLRQLPRSITALFNVAAHTAKQLGQFKSSTLSLIGQLLANGIFISKVKDCIRISGLIIMWVIFFPCAQVSSLNAESLAAMESTILKYVAKDTHSITAGP